MTHNDSASGEREWAHYLAQASARGCQRVRITTTIPARTVAVTTDLSQATALASPRSGKTTSRPAFVLDEMPYVAALPTPFLARFDESAGLSGPRRRLHLVQKAPSRMKQIAQWWTATTTAEVLTAYRPGMGKQLTLRRLMRRRPPMTITFNDRGETR